MSDKIEVKFLKIDEAATLPTCNDNTPDTGDTGYDVYASEDCIIPPKQSEVVPTGIVFAYITPGYWVRVEGRSGMGFKYDVVPHNGIIDNSYRGDAGVKLRNLGSQPYYVKKGDRIAQFVVYPLIHPEISWAEAIDETDRGANGFGSTGK